MGANGLDGGGGGGLVTTQQLESAAQKGLELYEQLMQEKTSHENDVVVMVELRRRTDMLQRVSRRSAPAVRCLQSCCSRCHVRLLVFVWL